MADGSGTTYFAEPHVEKQTMSFLLQSLGHDTSHQLPAAEIFYLQSQNGNLFGSKFFEEEGNEDTSEFEPLRADVPKEVPWATEAFGTFRVHRVIGIALEPFMIRTTPGCGKHMDRGCA